MRNKILLYILFYFSIHYNCSGQSMPDSNASGAVKWKYYRTETNLYEEGKFVSGRREGVWKYYSFKHILYKKEKYIHGLRKWTYIYHSNGRMIIYINQKGEVQKRPDCGC
ncbi:MAG: hypothetical protein SGJ10_13330 [Bacteroidota bacterium]|nr:hypothetical protein [Bacteroidota bacterium]